MRLIYNPKAEKEVVETVAFYGACSERVGRRFLNRFDRAIERICVYPKIGRSTSFGLRRLRVSGFPFSIVYGEDGGTIYVVALAHHRRKEDYWHGRVRN